MCVGVPHQAVALGSYFWIGGAKGSLLVVFGSFFFFYKVSGIKIGPTACQTRPYLIPVPFVWHYINCFKAVG